MKFVVENNPKFLSGLFATCGDDEVVGTTHLVFANGIIILVEGLLLKALGIKQVGHVDGSNGIVVFVHAEILVCFLNGFLGELYFFVSIGEFVESILHLQQHLLIPPGDSSVIRK